MSIADKMRMRRNRRLQQAQIQRQRELIERQKQQIQDANDEIQRHATLMNNQRNFLYGK